MHAFTLVRLRRTNLAQIRGDLADLFLRDTLDGDPVAFHLERDALGGLHVDGVRKTELELQASALLVDTVTSALNLDRKSVV